MPLKLICATVANSVAVSQKSRHTLLDTYLGHMLEKFELEQKVISKVFELLEKMSFLCHLWQSIDTILQDVAEAESIIVLW